MRKIFLFLAALTTAICATANNDGKIRVEGEVKDAQTNVPIAYANIIIEGTTFGTTTNDEGFFAIGNLVAKSYVMKVSFIGYETETIVIEDTKGNGVIHTHIFLCPKTTMMTPITISASRNHLRQETSLIVNTLNEKLFEATNAPNLLHSLPYQSGVRVEYNCQNCGSSQVKINGLDGPYTQILIDGRAVFSSLSSVYGLEQISSNMIERVEVVKGIGDALFGGTAIAGTINIITKEATNNSFAVSSNVELIGKKSLSRNFNASVSLLSKDNRAGVSFYSTFTGRDAYDADNDGYTEMGKIDARSFGTKGYYRINNQQKISAEYHTTNESRRGGNFLEQPPHLSDICEMTNHRIHSAGLTYDYLSLNGKNRYSVFSSAQYIDRDSYYGSSQDPNSYGLTKDLTIIGGIQGENKFNKILFSPMTITYGLEMTSNSINDRILGYDMKTKQATNILAAYLQTQWDFEKMQILVGERFDKHNLIENIIVSPRINLLYKPLESIQLRASYGSGYRAPQVFDEDLHIAQVGGLSLRTHLAENLRPEYSHNASASVDVYFEIGNNWKTNLLFESFYTKLTDVFALRVIAFDTLNSTMIQERYNASGASVYGLNFTKKFSFLDVHSLAFGYTIQSSKYDQTEFWSSDSNVIGTDKLLRMPDHYGFLTLSIQPFKRLDISITGTYTGEMFVAHFAGYIPQDKLEITPAFLDLNLAIAYTITLKSDLNLKLSAGIKNILNHYQTDFDKGSQRDANYIYGTMQPLTFFLSARFASN